MKQPTVLEKLKELEAQRAALIGEAKKAALEKAEAAIAELNVLGFAYFLGSEHQPKAPRRKKSDGEKGARHTPSDRRAATAASKRSRYTTNDPTVHKQKSGRLPTRSWSSLE